MALATTAELYISYDARAASFRATSKKRTSTATTRKLKWPHNFLGAEELAQAGFFYHPSPHSPDNVACFLCHKMLDGWEQGDDPLAEHLRHAPECGWAVVASLEAGHAELREENPMSARMVEARRATFADRWPHESKKGWKCKVKQLVDAGWKYTPTPDGDDMTTCVYCELALDGWDRTDKPLEEHLNRSPDCPFFALVERHKKKPRKGRASKASARGSAQSFTIAEDALPDAPTDLDSILTADTVDSTATAVPVKKPRAKAASTKTRKTKTKKNDAPMPEPTPEPAPAPMEPEDDDFEVKVDLPLKRGKKRASDETDNEPPPTKRRATQSTTEEAPPAPKGRKTAANTRATARSTRKASTESTASQATTGEANVRQMFAPMEVDESEVDAELQLLTEQAHEAESNQRQETKARRGKAREDAQNDDRSPSARRPTPEAPQVQTQNGSLEHEPEDSMAEAAVERRSQSTSPPRESTSTADGKGKAPAIREDSAPPETLTVPTKSTVGFVFPTPQKRSPLKELTPSPSPQSSDAENQPPSSRARTVTKAVPMAPFTTRTPTGSPSKRRNIVQGGLQTSHPWDEADVDMIFVKSPAAEKENGGGLLNTALDRAARGELSSPEKKMTVEQWIAYNASLAEDHLKTECERMVSLFEGEGGRAMHALEGIECIE